MLISADSAMNALREVVKGKEDFVYNPDGKLCRYFEDGNPSCVVGHVLAQLQPGRVFENIEGGSPLTISVFTVEAGTMLREAQIVQDEGFTWGDALKAAERYKEEVINA